MKKIIAIFFCGGLCVVACIFLIRPAHKNQNLLPVVLGETIDQNVNPPEIILRNGQRQPFSPDFQQILQKELWSGFVLSSTQSNEVYIATLRNDPYKKCSARSVVYRYNIRSGYFSESANVSGLVIPPKMLGSCRVLRLLGHTGSNLIVLGDDIENSGGPCAEPLLDYPSQLFVWNPDAPNNFTSFVPDSVLRSVALARQQKCLNTLSP